jgi:macrolide transport system ATP-binding/permease protein
MPNAPPLIELKDITRVFATDGGVEVHALKGVSLAIHRGEFVAIKGQSGSGKTTLMNILGCLDRPTSGEYRFDGRNVDSFDADELAWLRREAFGFVFQSYNLLPTATARENVEVPAIYAGVSLAERHRRSTEMLESLGLGDRTDHRPSQLSGGQQQRVSVARALMNGGQVILADEPTGALDTQSGEELMTLLEDLARSGHTIILITHDPSVAARADRVIEMRDGTIITDTGSGASSGQEHQTTHDLDMGATAARTLADTSEAARMALRSLRANIFRTVLTLLGIVIGVASVVTMMAIGEGAKERIVNQFSTLGANTISVYPNWRRGKAGAMLPLDLADRIESNLPNVEAVLPMVNGDAMVRAGNLDHEAEIYATSERLPEIRDWRVASGIFFDREDSDSYAPVAVLGATVVESLFPDTDPIGQYVIIRNVPFLVIGTLVRKGTGGFGNDDQDNAVFVPLRSGALRLFGRRHLNFVRVTVEDPTFINQTEHDIEQYLVETQGSDSYRIRNSAEMLEQMEEATATFTLLLGGIGAISLLVGGIGIMNIMLVSVTERTREIGVRMATGARQKDILLQFIVEAVVVSALGGVVGIALGLGLGAVLSLFAVPVAFETWPMALAFGCAAAIGLVFGYTPARNASQLDPVVALANE